MGRPGHFLRFRSCKNHFRSDLSLPRFARPWMPHRRSRCVRTMFPLARPRKSRGVFAKCPAGQRSDRGREIFMSATGCRALSFKACAAACIFLLCSGILVAQAPDIAPATSNSSTAELTNEVRTLSETVRQLQTQVQSLNTQLSEIRSKEHGQESTPDAVSNVPSGAGASVITDPY